ncbi:MAG: aminotransferase class III-fold pyridoxal phosphate-dependent enzyme, partial [Bacteroidota bacterium]
QNPNCQWAIALAREHFQLDVTAQPLPGEHDLNFHLRTKTTGTAYLLKISGPAASESNIDLQNQALLHLAQRAPELPLARVLPGTDGRYARRIRDAAGQVRWLRLHRWLDGQVWARRPARPTALFEKLGQRCGQVTTALLDFDHPAAHHFHPWNNAEGSWIREELHVHEAPAQRELVEYFLDRYEREVLPRQDQLRRSVIHNDANDYNILVDPDPRHTEIVGLLDFGDTIYSNTINDLAVAAAYALMDCPDPLARLRALVRGFHTALPLRTEEMSALFPLLTLRLCITVTVSARTAQVAPDNPDLLVSARPAWALLLKLRAYTPDCVHYHLRQACGLPPCPQHAPFQNWLRQNATTLTPVIATQAQKTVALDLSVGSLGLGNVDRYTDIERYQQTIDQLIRDQGGTIGIGGYSEVRPFYSTDAYTVSGNEGPQWRTVHLGQDIWAAAGTPVYAPYPGIVYSVQNNDQHLDYGPTIILEHRPPDGPPFYTLYGHLSRRSLSQHAVGDAVTAGSQIAWLGNAVENGHWPPHLHFQVILDPLGKRGDFPGVAFPAERDIWQSICPDWDWSAYRVDFPPGGDEASTIAEGRQQHLGRSLSLSYQRPLHIVRGSYQYLYDRTGRRYLDTANNVAHVGHQHPWVVRAGQAQMGVLNTNTRYLHEQIVRYAEELLATFPPELCVCHFVNSGSEANELALRMARTYTQQRDLLVVEVGYHGNTGQCIDISSYKFDGPGGRGAPPEVHVVPLPDVYRGRFRDPVTAGVAYAEAVGKKIRAVRDAGRGIAGFICEGILSCGGQIVLPPHYLQTAFAEVRGAGGLCIVDEVQTGFGRVGDHFWAFELQGVVPDIVTLGKPMGNGHPLGAVVCTRAVADAFVNGMEFFNTFGGNPVSCAIGREVLRVVREEGLQENARRVGQYFRERLGDVAERWPLLGDVRGHGLFLGLELVRDRAERSPAPEATHYLSNRMRDRGILTGTDGPDHNVIKIKPPLCFDRANVDFFVETLEGLLGEWPG